MLTLKQKKLIELAAENGYLNLSMARKIYSSSFNMEALKYLVASGYLKLYPGNFGSYLITEKGRQAIEKEEKQVMVEQFESSENKYLIILDNFNKRLQELEEKVEMLEKNDKE